MKPGGVGGQEFNKGISIYGIRLESCSNFVLNRLQMITSIDHLPSKLTSSSAPATGGFSGLGGGSGKVGNPGTNGNGSAVDTLLQCGTSGSGGAGTNSGSNIDKIYAC